MNKAPTRGQRLNLELDIQDYTERPKIFKNFNHLKVLQSLANKWVDRGCYNTPDRALRALIGGDL